MKIRFIRNYQVKAVDGPFYPEGSVHDLRDDAARHFLIRGAAIAVKEEIPLATPTPSQEIDPGINIDTAEVLKPRRGRPKKRDEEKHSNLGEP